MDEVSASDARPGTTGMDRCQVGGLRQQPQGALLYAHAGRAQTARERDGQAAAAGGGDQAGSGARSQEESSPRGADLLRKVTPHPAAHDRRPLPWEREKVGMHPSPWGEGGRGTRSGEGSLSCFGVSRSDMSDCSVGPRLFVAYAGLEVTWRHEV